MTDVSGLVLERSVRRGWRTLERWLTETLALMEDDAVLIVSIEQADDDSPTGARAPYVEFCTWGDGMIRAEVSSNTHLDAPYRLTAPQHAKLIEIGYAAPGGCDADVDPGCSTNFSVDVSRSFAGVAAKMSVAALRSVFGVLHPSFLTFAGGGLSDDFNDALAVPESQPAEPAGSTVVVPESPDHLRNIVGRCLTPLLGGKPYVDPDGDFAMYYSDALVYVRVVETAPAVAVFSELVVDAKDIDAATRLVSELNGSVEMVKFYLLGDRVLVGATLPAQPFVAEHLRTMLGVVAGVARDLDGDLAARVSGRPTLDGNYAA